MKRVSRIVAALGILVFASCASDGSDGTNSLATSSPEPAGDNCPSGGVRVDVGLDVDGDGVLDPDEVANTDYVCNGAGGSSSDGLQSLVITSAEPAGANCAAGGTRIDSGVDVSDDGILDPGEIDSTAYVCNALQTLTEFTTEVAGANCANGGERIDMGLDLDNDGTLDAGEIATTAFVCDGAAGADGLEALVAQTAEPAGANCASGGVRVDSGLDVDDDNTLDANEIVDTFYVCDGADGSNGSNGNDGLESLIVVSEEPQGPNCTYGGARIDAGLDSSDDGILDPGEISTTSYACSSGTGFVNGSFEDDYNAWILDQSAVGRTQAIVADGTTVTAVVDQLFDYFDGVDETVFWCGAGAQSHTLDASDGSFSAAIYDTNVGSTRMYQDITIPLDATQLSWDMRFLNAEGSWSAGQELVVEVRSTNTDAVLTTLYTTEAPLPTTDSGALANFSANLSSYAGQTVRINFQTNTSLNCQWYQLDNIRVQ